MFEKPQASHVLGLDIDTFSLKGVAIAFTRGKPRLESAFDFSTAPAPTETNSDNVKPLYTAEQQQTLDTLSQSHLIVTAMETPEVLMRPLDLKIKRSRDVDAVLTFQAEPLLPYPTDNAVLDRIILSQDNSGTKLSLVSVRKDHLATNIQLWNSLGIEPEVISSAPLAIALFAKTFAAPHDLCYALHLGWTHSFCALVENGRPIAAQTVTGGISAIVDTVAREQGIDVTELRQHLNEDQFLAARGSAGFKTALEILRASVTRTIYGLAKQIRGREVTNLLVTGPGASIPGFSETIAGALNKTILEVPNATTFGMNSHELIKFALPIGQALSALPDCKDQINFRQGEHAFPSPWKRLKQPILLYLGLCVAVAIALVFYGRAYISDQEGHIKLQYLDLLAGMNRSYPDFEREYMAKTKSTPADLAPGEVIPVKDLSPEQIKSRLQFLEKEIQAIPQIYPLQPNTPLVSDVLAWISTHPAFIGKSTEAPIDLPEQSQLSQTLQIESFNYVMSKRPDPSKKGEKYQVKIEMEFSSPTPKMAREFHDALIAPNDIVDPKAEIKWSSNKDRYRTSFYLKDRTVYPAP